MNILMINPYVGAVGALKGVGGNQPPLGLCYLAAVLLKEGHEVRICDEGVGQDGESAIRDFKHEVLFLSVYPNVSDRAKGLIKLSREMSSSKGKPAESDGKKPNSRDAKESGGVLVVAGGPIGQGSVAEHFLGEIGCDVIVMGEGEESTIRLLKEGRKAWPDIPGLVFMKGGRAFRTAEPTLVQDLDSLPFPAIQLLDLDRYVGPIEAGFFESAGKRCTSVMTARGCSFKCYFCSSPRKYDGRVRFRSPKNAVDEIERDVKELGIRHFAINDDTFTANIPRVIEFCKEIVDRDLRIQWICQTRGELGTLEMFEWMKKAGCTIVAFGVESGSQKVLDRCNKNLNLDLLRRGISHARKAGLRIKTYWQVGLPGESEEEFQESLRLVKELNPDYAWCSMFTPLPNTVFYDELAASGEIKADGLKSLTYFSYNRDADIIARHKRFMRGFYLRVPYLLRFLRRFTFDEFKYMVRMGIVFVRLQLARR